MAQPTFDSELIEALLLRSLTSSEETFAGTLWGMAWRRVITRRPSIATTTPPVMGDLLAMVVARILRNPGGYRSETDGDYSYTLLGGDPTRLDLTADDWAQLVPRSGAFTVDPTPANAGAGLPWWDTSDAQFYREPW